MFDDDAVGHEHDPVGDVGEQRLVGDDDHCHARPREVTHGVEDTVDQFGI